MLYLMIGTTVETGYFHTGLSFENSEGKGSSKMNKYEITTEKKKNSIVNAALTLFKENGFTNVNVKEIAALIIILETRKP